MTTAIVTNTIQPRSPRGEFVNEPFTDFKTPENARAMKAALSEVETHMGHEYGLIIDGKRLMTADKIRSTNPARPGQVVGVHQKAGAEHAELAMTAAVRAFESWRKVSPEERAALLLHAAQIIRGRKFEFMAGLTFKVGKTWDEADAEENE